MIYLNLCEHGQDHWALGALQSVLKDLPQAAHVCSFCQAYHRLWFRRYFLRRVERVLGWGLASGPSDFTLHACEGLSFYGDLIDQ